mgnify:CR=1 FL=1
MFFFSVFHIFHPCFVPEQQLVIRSIAFYRQTKKNGSERNWYFTEFLFASRSVDKSFATIAFGSPTKKPCCSSSRRRSVCGKTVGGRTSSGFFALSMVELSATWRPALSESAIAQLRAPSLAFQLGCSCRSDCGAAKRSGADVTP